MDEMKTTFWMLLRLFVISFVGATFISSNSLKSIKEIEEKYVDDYKPLFGPIFAVIINTVLFIVILYTHLAPYHFLKNIKRRGQSSDGEVLSCEIYQQQDNNPHHKQDGDALIYEIVVIFKYNGSRYLRRIITTNPMTRGDKIDFLVHPKNVGFALPRDLLERDLSAHSHLKSIIIVILGSIISGVIFTYATITATQYKHPAQARLIVLTSYIFSITLGLGIAGAIWDNTKNSQYTLGKNTISNGSSRRKLAASEII